MNNAEKRKDYMRKIYSKQWTRKRAEYGIEQYDRDLISEISSCVKKERGGENFRSSDWRWFPLCE